MSHTLAVLGATGAAGDQLLASLHGSPLVTGPVLAFASPRRSARVDTVSFGPDSLPVAPVSALLEASAHLVFSCVPSDVALRFLPTLIARSILVIDVGNSTRGSLDLPLWMPDHAIDPTKAGLRTPSALGWLLSTVVAAVPGVTGVSGSAIEGAVRRGKPGAEELGQQLLANFSGQESHRRIWPDGLAFDVVGEDVPIDEWSAYERTAAEEVSALCGLPADQIAVTAQVVPVFQGVVATLHLRGVDVDTAERGLLDAGLKSASAKLRPRAVSGRAAPVWGRLRADPAGDGVHLVVVGDNLAGAAAAIPLLAAQALRDAGLLDRQ